MEMGSSSFFFFAFATRLLYYFAWNCASVLDNASNSCYNANIQQIVLTCKP